MSPESNRARRERGEKERLPGGGGEPKGGYGDSRSPWQEAEEHHYPETIVRAFEGGGY